MLKQPPPGPDEWAEQPPVQYDVLTWGVLLKRFFVVAIALSIVVLMMYPSIWVKPHYCSRNVTASSNAKEIFKYMVVFDTDFGSFPSDATVPKVISMTGIRYDYYDGSSNSYFRQLIAANSTMGEKIFYCDHPQGGRRPDDDVTGHHALEAGEVGFSYIPGLGTLSKSGVPVLMAVMDTASYECFISDDSFNNKAIILTSSNSLETYDISPSDKKVYVDGVCTVFDPASGIWGDGASWPDIRHPDF